MTSIALIPCETRTLSPVRTTALVVDRPSSRSRSGVRSNSSSRRGARSLADAVRAYYAAKFSILAGIVTVATMAGAFIGQL